MNSYLVAEIIQKFTGLMLKITYVPNLFVFQTTNGLFLIYAWYIIFYRVKYYNLTTINIFQRTKYTFRRFMFAGRWITVSMYLHFLSKKYIVVVGKFTVLKINYHLIIVCVCLLNTNNNKKKNIASIYYKGSTFLPISIH